MTKGKFYYAFYEQLNNLSETLEDAIVEAQRSIIANDFSNDDGNYRTCVILKVVAVINAKTAFDIEYLND